MPVAEPRAPGAPGRFPSLAAMQAAHRELMKAAREAPDQAPPRGRVLQFLEKGHGTGAILDDLADRGTAQSMLDYWTATLYTVPAGGFEKAATPVPSGALADFDEKELKHVADAAE